MHYLTPHEAAVKLAIVKARLSSATEVAHKAKPGADYQAAWFKVNALKREFFALRNYGYFPDAWESKLARTMDNARATLEFYGWAKTGEKPGILGHKIEVYTRGKATFELTDVTWRRVTVFGTIKRIRPLTPVQLARREAELQSRAEAQRKFFDNNPDFPID